MADLDDDWAPCQGHPPYATAGFVGCSDTWPPPADDPPDGHSVRLAEASAALGLGAGALKNSEPGDGEGSGPR